MSKHRIDNGGDGTWTRLRNAGLGIIVALGLVLLALSIGMCLGMRMLEVPWMGAS